jgi:hypothetical protein
MGCPPRYVRTIPARVRVKRTTATTVAMTATTVRAITRGELTFARY